MSYTPTEWESTDVVTATRMNALEQAVGDMNMSYTPNTWSDGDILSAEKMNALKQAVASGGGGSSDFSTATVTVINDSSDGVTMSGAFFDEGAVYGTVYGEELSAPGTQEMSLIVYKNASSELYFDLGTTTITTITGDATQRGSAYVDVTGDCTITIS